MLKTRGVPGTHDTGELARCLDELRTRKRGINVTWPRFDKLADDRLPKPALNTAIAPVDIVLLEGWCVGVGAETEAALQRPVNELERHEDPAGHWRKFVNGALREHYEPIFAGIDTLAFLRAPGFAAIRRWRLEQERALARHRNSSERMDRPDVERFVQHFERLTRVSLATLPDRAHALLELCDSHRLHRTPLPDICESS